MAKKKFDYFNAFTESTELAVQYAEGLQKYLEKNLEIQRGGSEPDPEKAKVRFEELHALEHQADQIVHQLIKALAVEFITPIEREDILILINALDSIIDDMDDVLMRMYMYDVHSVTPSCVELAQVMTKAVRAVHEATIMLPNFKKEHDQLHELLVKVNTFEDEADTIFIESMHEIYHDARLAQNPIDTLGISGILAALEKCCDACERASDAMTTVIMKNS